MTELIWALQAMNSSPLPVPISLRRRIYVDVLCALDKLYHFDDDPADILSSKTNLPLFTPEEIVLVRQMTNELHHGELFALALKAIEKKNNEDTSST